MIETNEILSSITDDTLELLCKNKRYHFIKRLIAHWNLIRNTTVKNYCQELFTLSTKFNILEKYNRNHSNVRYL